MSYYKIQLSYPETMVQPLNSDQDFFFITTGVPFNLSFIDASNSVSISGSSTKGMLREKVFNAKANAELIINHKTPSGTNFHLVVPIVNDARAKTSLSNYINSTKETALNLGSDIESSDIEYYKDGNTNVFVVKTPVKVNMPKDVVLQNNNIIGKPSGTPVSIKSTSLNDEVVCDYEGEDTDSAKTPEAKSDDWAAALTLIGCIAIFFIAFSSLRSISDQDTRDKVFAAVGLASLVAAIVMSVYAAKEKKATYSIATTFFWAMLLMVVWLKFRPSS